MLNLKRYLILPRGIVLADFVNYSGSESLGVSMALALKDIERWQELGHQLDISPEKLSELLNCGQSGAECRDKMVAYWEKHDIDASWEKLARALARMGENKVAEKIVDEHVKKTSTPSVLPQEVELKSKCYSRTCPTHLLYSS